MLVRVVTPPDTEPVAIDEAREFSRIDGNFDDAVVGGLIVSARQMAESYLRRSLITRTLRAFLDSFPNAVSQPGYSQSGAISTQNLDNFTRNAITIRGEACCDDDGRIHLPFPPLRQVITVSYLQASNGAAATMPPADYVVDSEGSLIALAYGKSWPTARSGIPGAVYIDYIAGYGAPGEVPESIRLWIKRKASDINENRETREDPKGYSLLRPYRFYQFS